LHAYLTLAVVENDIRKRKTDPSTHYTGGWVGQRGSLEAIDKRKFSLFSEIKPTFLYQPTIHFATTLA
jgi:hypothetical protein